MPRVKLSPIRRVLTLAVALSALAACGTDNDGAVRISVIDSSDSLKIDALDLSPLANVQRAATSQGLVSFDASGDIIAGLAERWIVTDDGRSFIFRLRNAQWNNGDPVTSDHVAAALRRRIAAEKRTRLGADLSDIRDIRAMTGRVVEIRLKSPKPDFLRILAQPELGLRRSGNGTGPLVALRAGRWTEVKSPEDDSEESDMPPRNERPLFIRGDDPQIAIARFSLGDAEVVMGGRFQHLPFLAVAQIDSNAIQFDPVSGLFGLLVVENTGFLASSANRAAIAMAIDRDQLMTGLNLSAWQNTTRYVPAKADDYTAKQIERWTSMSVSERQQVARDRVNLWKLGNGTPRRLKIAMPEGPGSRLLFARIKADLAAIGLDSQRVNLNANADLRLIDEVATYNKATWYLNQLSCTIRSICNEEGDELLAKARRAVDPAVRQNDLADAEVKMTAANYFIPLGAPVRWSLVKPGLSGFLVTENGWHPLPEFAIIPR